MSEDEMKALFEKHEDEFIRFERIPEADRRHPRSDICAFIYLHEKLGGKGDMVVAAEHDEIFLDGDMEAVAEKLTEGDIIYLHRCGVRMGEYCLCMFV